MANSILTYSGTGYAINLTGSDNTGTSQALHSLDNYRNFTLQDSAPTTNNGMSLTNKAWWKIEDVTFNLFNYGLNIDSCYAATVASCNFVSCNYGVQLTTTALGPPNLIRFDNCVFQTCYLLGVTGASVGTGIIFNSCNFESCGQQGQPNQGAVLLSMSDTYGNVGPVIFDNCYFEGDAGVADIIINNASTTHELTVVIKNCLFQRISNTNYVTNNINVTTNGGPVNVILQGNSFYSAGTYVPSASRLFWAGGANVIFLDNGGNVYSETTSLPAQTEGHTVGATAFAMVQYYPSTATSVVLSNCTMTKNSTGNYTVTFLKKPPTGNYVASVTTDRGSSATTGIKYVAQSQSSFNFTITNASGVLFDPDAVSA